MGTIDIGVKAVMPITMKPKRTFTRQMLLRIAQLSSKYTGTGAMVADMMPRARIRQLQQDLPQIQDLAPSLISIHNHPFRCARPPSHRSILLPIALHWASATKSRPIEAVKWGLETENVSQTLSKLEHVLNLLFQRLVVQGTSGDSSVLRWVEA